MDASSQALRAVPAVTAWMLASSALIFMNKQIYVEGFRFPMMSTGLGQLLSFAGGVALVLLRVLPCRPPPAREQLVKTMLPIVVCSVGTLWLGNLAYLYLQVAFIQILKGLTPGLTLLLGGVTGVEEVTPVLALAVTMTGGGTGLGALIEINTARFSWWGLLAFLGSSVTEAMRVVLVAKLQTRGIAAFNTAESLIYISLPCAVCLILMSLAFESPGVLGVGLQLMARRPAFYLLAFSTSFLVNMTCYYALQVTSSVTFKVVGCLKNLLVISIGMLRGDTVTPSQLIGYLVSMAGFILFSVTKHMSRRTRAKAE